MDVAPPGPAYLHGCAPPSPQIKSYFNPRTNETAYILTEVRVHEIGIRYNYEIRHAKNYAWEDAGEEGEAGGGGLLDRASDFFGSLFGRGDAEEGEGTDVGDAGDAASGGGSEELRRVEESTVSRIWEKYLEDDRMTWGVPQEECAGLVTAENDVGEGEVKEEEKEEEATRTRRRHLPWRVPQPGHQEADSGDQRRILQAEGGDVVDALDATETNGTGATATGDIVDTEETLTEETVDYSTFSGTKTLGLTYRPLDAVDHEGCRVPDATCTAIRGQLSAAYSGLDEYSVIQTVIAQLRKGMDDGSFLPPASPALGLTFVNSGGTVAVGGGGSSYRLNTARGTTPDAPPEPEESYLSQYGIAFVCLVAVLGSATLGAVHARRRKRRRRLARAREEEGLEWSEEEHEQHLALGRAEDGPGAGEGRTAEESDSRSGTATPSSAGARSPVAGVVQPAVVPAVNSNGSVEFSLADSKRFDF